jgi:hypothetical protein
MSRSYCQELEFDTETIMRLPPDGRAALIAHELAHVEQFVTRWPVDRGPRADERDADERATRWGCPWQRAWDVIPGTE